MRPENFLTETLRRHPYGGRITRILAAAMQAVEPSAAVRQFLRREANQLIIADKAYDLEKIKRIRVLGLGKAAPALSAPVAEILADRAPRGLLIPKGTFLAPWAGFETQPGGHPVPDENSLKAGQKALALARGLSADDLLVCLISGGGSALMVCPLPGLSLDDLQALTRSLLACGARIDEINTLRRHLDQVKGGGLARAASPARVASLILSDVVGDGLEVIASGPTAPDPSTGAQALGVLAKYGLTGKVPAAICQGLENAPETPKPGEGLFAQVQNVIVGNNARAAQSALRQATGEGFHPKFLGDDWQGEARLTADRLCEHFNRGYRRPFCLVGGGETTVTLTARPGRGGRNQELALAAVQALSRLENVVLVSLATDGEDGTGEAAGAVASNETLLRARALGLDPAVFLERNDSYHFFEPLGDLLQCGPSGTNVNDLFFLFGF